MNCPHCSKLLKVRSEILGKRVRCTGCSKVFRVPEPAHSVSESETFSTAPYEEKSSGTPFVKIVFAVLGYLLAGAAFWWAFDRDRSMRSTADELSQIQAQCHELETSRQKAKDEIASTNRIAETLRGQLDAERKQSDKLRKKAQEEVASVNQVVADLRKEVDALRKPNPTGVKDPESKTGQGGIAKLDPKKDEPSKPSAKADEVKHGSAGGPAQEKDAKLKLETFANVLGKRPGSAEIAQFVKIHGSPEETFRDMGATMWYWGTTKPRRFMFTFDLGKLQQIVIFDGYQGELPAKLTFADSRDVVAAKVGKEFEKSGNYFCQGFSVLFEYKKDHIRSVTMNYSDELVFNEKTLKFDRKSKDLPIDVAQDSGQVIKELENFQGKWQLTRYEFGGVKMTDSAIPQHIEIKDNKLLHVIGRGPNVKPLESVITIDPAKNPKQIDLTFKNERVHGIYRLENGSLTIWRALGVGGRRPEGFSDRKSWHVMELRKIDPAEKTGDEKPKMEKRSGS